MPLLLLNHLNDAKNTVVGKTFSKLAKSGIPSPDPFQSQTNCESLVYGNDMYLW